MRLARAPPFSDPCRRRRVESPPPPSARGLQRKERSMRRASGVRAALVLLLSAAVGIGCSGTPLVDPVGSADPQAAGGRPSVPGLQVSISEPAGTFSDPPNAVFKTAPAADPTGFIGGAAPLDVTYNMCRTSDDDPGDELKFRYDFEGTGRFERGRCRETRAYAAGCRRPTVFTSDRQPDHELCKTYLVCADAPGPSGPQLPEFLTCTAGATGVIPPGQTRTFTLSRSSGTSSIRFPTVPAPLTYVATRTSPPPPTVVLSGTAPARATLTIGTFFPPVASFALTVT